jgi:hypothetical protein
MPDARLQLGEKEGPRASNARRVSRVLGSLPMALVLLPAFAAALALGIYAESAYGARFAQQLVYQAWWFALLLGVVGVNIFCAAAKKWPWKKPQTGFLVTHLGLLTLVAGGMLDSQGGVHGVMTLIDTEDDRFRSFGFPATNVIVEPHRDIIRVARPRKNREEVLYRPFDPGFFPWQRRESDTAPLLARGLAWLTHPWPRSWAMDLGDETRLEVVDYFPHALPQTFAPAAPDDPAAFPALAVDLASPATGHLPQAWLGLHDPHRTFWLGPGLVEFLGRHPRPEQLAEFENPPTADQAGTKGVLVLGLAGQTFRFDVERALAKGLEPLGSTGWNLHLKQYLADYRDQANATAVDPGLALELTRPEGTIGLALVARQAGEIFPIGREPIPRPTGLWTWYHLPDNSYGDPSLKGMLQLLAGADGDAFFRSFVRAQSGALQFEKAGRVTVGAGFERIWSGMGWRFRVPESLPRAAPGPYFMPAIRPLGREDAETVQAIKCRLTQGTFSKEFLAAKSEGAFTPVRIGGDEYLVGYHSSQVELDFALRLVRAEQTTDVGSVLPASQTSFVALTDPDQGIHGEGRTITLNQPLVHRGYKFYQAGYKSLGTDSQEKPVSRSVLLVGYDPGLWLKYAGSAMVALGIACMFYMKAYFFKGRVNG